VSEARRGLTLDEVRVTLGARPLLDLSLHVEPGAVVTVMGPSGSGKSSLLAYLAGTLPDALTGTGRVLLDGRNIVPLAPELRRIGLMFQDDLLFPHLSVLQNLMFAIPRGAGPRARRRERAEAALAEMDLAGFGPRDPATLSGGQRSRAALARMLLSEPRAMLLDEPFSKLDLALRAQIRALVFAKAAERGLPALLVTHDPADAEAAGGAVVTLG